MKKKIIIIFLILAILAGGTWFFFFREKKLTEEDFDMVPVTKGNVTYTVTASGTIQPLNTVDVGTQVSGLIEKVLVDYNDEVKEGQLLARLDISTLNEAVNEAKAHLDIAEAELKPTMQNCAIWILIHYIMSVIALMGIIPIFGLIG